MMEHSEIPLLDAPYGSTDSTHTVGVVVVTYNSARTIEQCLKSVLRGGPVSRVVVVDNASVDSTCEIVKQYEPEVQLVVNSENRGFGSACNYGATLVKEPVIAFVNPDAAAVGDTITILLDALQSNTDVIATGPALLNANGQREFSARTFPSALNVFYNRRYHELFPRGRHHDLVSYLNLEADLTSTFFCDWLSGAFFLMRRRDFERVGGFDEKFFLYFEDVDLFYRLAAGAPRRALFVGCAIAQHEIGASSRGVSLKAAGWKLKSAARYYARYRRAGLRSDLIFASASIGAIALEILARLRRPRRSSPDTSSS